MDKSFLLLFFKKEVLFFFENSESQVATARTKKLFPFWNLCIRGMGSPSDRA
jgi:hypothetical protein